MLQAFGNRVVALFATSTMIIIGLLGAVRSVTLWQQNAQLTSEGQPLQGEVIAKETNYPLGSRYLLTYQVEVDGNTVQQQERVSRPMYNRYEAGDPIAVLSLPGFTLPLAIEGNNSGLIRFTATAAAWLISGIGLAIFYMVYLTRLETLRAELPPLDIPPELFSSHEPGSPDSDTWPNSTKQP